MEPRGNQTGLSSSSPTWPLPKEYFWNVANLLVPRSIQEFPLPYPTQYLPYIPYLVTNVPVPVPYAHGMDMSMYGMY